MASSIFLPGDGGYVQMKLIVDRQSDYYLFETVYEIMVTLLLDITSAFKVDD